MGLSSGKDFPRLGYEDGTALADNLYLLLTRDKLAKRLMLDASPDAETQRAILNHQFVEGSNVCRRG